jgi:hypothetical protein
VTVGSVSGKRSRKNRFGSVWGWDASPKDVRPHWRRYDAKAGLSLHDAMIFYGPEFEARTVFELELEGFAGEPPPLVDLSGWPNTAEVREFELNAMRLQRHRQTLQQYLRDKLQSGELYATGYAADTPLDRNAPKVAADRWRILEPDFQKSEARSPTGIIVGILVFSPGFSEASVRRGGFSQAALRNWYTDWVHENLENGKSRVAMTTRPRPKRGLGHPFRVM